MAAPTQATSEKRELTPTELQIKLTVTEASAKENALLICKLQEELKEKNRECDELKIKNARLELDVVEAAMRSKQNVTETTEVHKMKLQSEEVLTRAKSIIFEKTKVCKNQELQIEALNAQVTSLKDVVQITKNMLEIRNIEVKHMQDQIQCMNDKVAAEKERQDMVHKKLERMIQLNTDLKREYETQLCLFNALRERYSERELARGVLDRAAQNIAEDSPAQESSSSSNDNVNTESTQ